MHKDKFFKGYSPIEEANTSTPKPIMRSKGRMYIVDSGASSHMMMEKSSPCPQEDKTIRQTKHHLEIQTANSIVRCAKELGTRSWLKIHWRKPEVNQRQENRHVLHRKFRSSCCSHSAECHTIYHDPTREKNPCARERSGGYHAKIDGTFL